MTAAARHSQPVGTGDTIDPYAGRDRISIPRARRHWLVSGGLAWLDPWPQQGLAALLAQGSRGRS